MAFPDNAHRHYNETESFTFKGKPVMEHKTQKMI